MWDFIHSVSVRASATDVVQLRKDFVETMHLFSDICPCGVCRRSIQQLFQEKEVDPSNLLKYEKTSLATWGWKLHNAVNTKLDKPLVEFDQAARRMLFEVDPLPDGTIYQLLSTVIQQSYEKDPLKTSLFTHLVLKLSSEVPSMHRNLVNVAESHIPELAERPSGPIAELKTRLQSVGADVFGKDAARIEWAPVSKELSADDMGIVFSN
jgi:hypothetical protein